MEHFKVFIEPAAKTDLHDILPYITEALYEPKIAERICESIETAIFSLQQLPMRYNVIEEEPFSSKMIRKMPVKNYSIFYTVDNAGKEVHILRVVYSRRDWKNLF